MKIILIVAGVMVGSAVIVIIVAERFLRFVAEEDNGPEQDAGIVPAAGTELKKHCPWHEGPLKQRVPGVTSGICNECEENFRAEHGIPKEAM